MAFFGTAHILAALSGPGGSEVLHDTGTFRGFLDEEDVVQADVTGENLLIRQTVLRVLTGSPAVERGDIVTVEGTDYKVRDSRREADGAMTTIVLARWE